MSDTSASSLLVADGHLQREGGQDRKTIDVAVGILINAQNQFLAKLKDGQSAAPQIL